jgi:hypothetical protein
VFPVAELIYTFVAHNRLDERATRELLSALADVSLHVLGQSPVATANNLSSAWA